MAGNTGTGWTIRPSRTDEDAYLAQNYLDMWLANGTPPQDVRPDWMDVTLRFIEDARSRMSFQGFVAESGGDRVGSACCQMYGGLYPEITMTEMAKRGYIWGVYVLAPHRRTGIGRALVQCCADHLFSAGCREIVLHPSSQGLSLYTAMGFTRSWEMSLFR